MFVLKLHVDFLFFPKMGNTILFWENYLLLIFFKAKIAHFSSEFSKLTYIMIPDAEVSPVFLRIQKKNYLFSASVFSCRLYKIYPQKVMIGGMYLDVQPQQFAPWPV